MVIGTIYGAWPARDNFLKIEGNGPRPKTPLFSYSFFSPRIVLPLLYKGITYRILPPIFHLFLQKGIFHWEVNYIYYFISNGKVVAWYGNVSLEQYKIWWFYELFYLLRFKERPAVPIYCPSILHETLMCLCPVGSWLSMDMWFECVLCLLIGTFNRVRQRTKVKKLEVFRPPLLNFYSPYFLIPRATCNQCNPVIFVET